MVNVKQQKNIQKNVASKKKKFNESYKRTQLLHSDKNLANFKSWNVWLEEKIGSIINLFQALWHWKRKLHGTISV